MSNHSVRYRVTNWKDYNQALIRRGDITLWLTEEVIDSWQKPAPTCKPGRPRTYSDLAVQCMLVLRLLYHLPLRSVQGLMSSLLELLNSPLPVPNYSTLCRRQSSAHLNLQLHQSEGPLHLLVDSTDLKSLWRRRMESAPAWKGKAPLLEQAASGH